MIASVPSTNPLNGGETVSTGEQDGKTRAEAPVLVKTGNKKKANTALPLAA